MDLWNAFITTRTLSDSAAKHVARTSPKTLAEVAWHLYLNRKTMSSGKLVALASKHEVGTLQRSYIECEHVKRLNEDLDTRHALVLGERVLDELQDATGEQAQLVRSRTHNNLAVAYREAGDFKSSFEHNHSALAISRANAFLDSLSHMKTLGTLLWLSGQPELGLAAHQDFKVRERAEELGKYEFLVGSHLSAAKCAIDADLLLEAEAELDLAESLSPSCEFLGYLYLYRAELDVLSGNIDSDEYWTAINNARDHFESVGYRLGVIDCKVQLTRFFVQFRSTELATVIGPWIRSLADEALEANFLNAHSRLALLEVETALRGTTSKQACDDLLLRAESIRNPATMMRVLGNLHTVAIRQADAESQKATFDRILQLRELLTDECYADLFQEYVQGHYQR